MHPLDQETIVNQPTQLSEFPVNEDVKVRIRCLFAIYVKDDVRTPEASQLLQPRYNCGAVLSLP